MCQAGAFRFRHVAIGLTYNKIKILLCVYIICFSSSYAHPKDERGKQVQKPTHFSALILHVLAAMALAGRDERFGVVVLGTGGTGMKLNLTIGKKLGLGFGVLVMLIVASSTVTYIKVSQLREIESRVVNLRYPTVIAGREMVNGVNHSLAGLRGYMILGGDPAMAAAFKKDRAAGWNEIEGALGQMESFAVNWTDPANIAYLKQVKKEVKGFSQAQQEVEDISHTDENIPSFNILLTEAAPRAGKMLAAVTAIIDEESTLEATAERKALLKNLADTRGSFAVGLANIRAYLLSGDDKFKGKFQKKWAVNEKVFEEITGKLGLFTPTQREQWDIYAANRIDFAPLPAKMFASRGAADWNLANYWLGTKAAPRAKAIAGLLAKMAESQQGLMANDLENLKAVNSSVVFTLVIATASSALIGIFVAFFLSRRIVGALRLLVDRTEQIAGGDLTGEAIEVKSHDELGALTGATNVMLGSLRELVSQVGSTSQEVAGAATQIAASSEEMAQGMGEQNQQVTQISAAVEEMSASIVEVARKSAEAASSAQGSGKVAQEGGQIVSETIRGMSEISDAVSASAASVAELGKRGEQIGQIIEVINDIADQTNLLALNAAIEAARAGEHGRGFAVVADEVRKLADRTTKATEEIGESITAIQTETDQAVQRMNAGTDQVKAGVEKATQAGQSLEQIVAGAGEVAEKIQSIAAAAEEQSAASEQVSRGVQSVSAVTSQSAEGASQSAMAASQLSTKAEQLQALVGKFKL
jgi:methyl-accepting chemotaxis protein